MSGIEERRSAPSAGAVVDAERARRLAKLQLFVARDDLGADVDALDRGDWVGAVGTVIRTRAGELSVRAREVRLLSKSLRALPDKHGGLTDVDRRLRERYLDLIANPDARRVFDVHPVAIVYGAAMVVALVWFRDGFRARADPASLLQAVRFVPAYLALVLAFGSLSLLLERDRVTPGLSVGGVLETVFGGLVGIAGPYRFESRFLADFVDAALPALGVAGLVVFSALIFRAVARRSGPTASDRERAHELVRAYGSDTLAYFALRDDKSYFFSRDGQALIPYTFVSGYALAAGDPIGAPAAVPAAVDEFLAFCRERAWSVAFLAVRERDAAIYRRDGLRSVYLGDEAIIRCDTFTLDGGAMKAVRTAVRRVGRRHRFRLMRETDAAPELREQLNRIRERWRGKAPERGFTMELGGGVRGEDPELLLAVATDGDERPVAFLRLVPCYGDAPGYSLDLMQRDPDAVNGVTEWLPRSIVVSSAAAMPKVGLLYASVEGFVGLPLVGRYLVPTVPSERGQAAD